jgi:hypothetical protein
LSIEHWSLAISEYATQLVALLHQSRFESSFGVIRSHSSMTNDHFSILNFQFTSKDRWPSPLMQPQQNLTCLQRLLVFKDSRARHSVRVGWLRGATARTECRALPAFNT